MAGTVELADARSVVVPGLGGDASAQQPEPLDRSAAAKPGGMSFSHAPDAIPAVTQMLLKSWVSKITSKRAQMCWQLKFTMPMQVLRT